MEIKDRRVLILGGWGLVGMATLRRLLEKQPDQVVILSLQKEEAREAVKTLSNEYPGAKLIPVWGNIFVRDSLKDLPKNAILEDNEKRQQYVSDVMEGLNDDILRSSFLYQVISKYKPHIIVDAVNTATVLAYEDIYSRYFRVKAGFDRISKAGGSIDGLRREMEKLVATLYIPQIIRHIQILYVSMVEAGTKVYVKIGTSGTGGMGLNIPYTHSEERPSPVLLSKSSVAGAHSLLLFLMGRTLEGPIVKEIKPAAAVAWKSIEYGPVRKRNRPLRLYDCPPEAGVTLRDSFYVDGDENWVSLNRNMESVYINTGENGILSWAEFEALTSVGQMEFITPEEIADNVVMEIVGDSTGHDIISALDTSIMGPSYRAGYMRESALRQMEMLMNEHGCESVAFELLGPPRLSKLLHEANLLRRKCASLRSVAEKSAGELVHDMDVIIRNDSDLRSQIISIGIPILLSDGKTLLRGPHVAIPVSPGGGDIPLSEEKIDRWSTNGWVDLRKSNIELWQKRVRQIIELAEGIPSEDTSSRYHHGRQYWGVDEPINVGKLAAWIFINEDKGMRAKE